jgi:hypothetical protein
MFLTIPVDVPCQFVTREFQHVVDVLAVIWCEWLRL